MRTKWKVFNPDSHEVGTEPELVGKFDHPFCLAELFLLLGLQLLGLVTGSKQSTSLSPLYLLYWALGILPPTETKTKYPS